MIDVDLLIRNFVTYFKSKTDFSDMEFLCGYPKRTKPYPLDKPTVAVGISAMEERKVTPVYSEDATPVLLYNRVQTVKIRFDIHVPQEDCGQSCYAVFSRIGDAILETGFNLKFVAAGCGDVKYDRECRAFVMPSWIELSQTLIV